MEPLSRENPLPFELENIVSVRAELIRSLYFPKGDVLIRTTDIDRRKRALNQIGLLSKSPFDQFKIYFEDIEGLKQIISPITGLNEKELSLSANLNIPVHRIVGLYKLEKD